MKLNKQQNFVSEIFDTRDFHKADFKLIVLEFSKINRDKVFNSKYVESCTVDLYDLLNKLINNKKLVLVKNSRTSTYPE